VRRGELACLRRLTCLHSAGHNRSGGQSQNASTGLVSITGGRVETCGGRSNLLWLSLWGLPSHHAASLPPTVETATQEVSAPISLSDCLEIEDQTKERLDCYDALVVVATEPGVVSCRGVGEQDDRLKCFNNQFASAPPVSAPVVPLRIASAPAPALRPVSTPPAATYGGGGGCGSRGGPGYRLASGKCASHRSGVRSRSGYRVRAGYRSRWASSYRRRR